MKQALFLLLAIYASNELLCQVELKRQADWGARFISAHPARPGMVVRRLEKGSALERSGVREGDLVLRIGTISLADQIIAGKTIRSYKAGDNAELTITRGDTLARHMVRLAARPLESYKGVDVTYGSVITDIGHQVRTIFTSPKSVKAKVPAIFIVQWLSCDQVEINSQRVSRYDSLFYQLITESGFAVMRVEKPGLGDSEGPDCTECDYNTELAAYSAALKALKKNAVVDTSSIYVLGISIGASGAPLLFSKENIKGMIVTGGFSKTWFEHMLEIERRRLELSGSSPGEISAMIMKYTKFYDEYLIGKKTPMQVLNEHPDLKGIWYENDEHQYERPAAYYQQVQDKNVAEAWTQVNFPVLVIYGEYDWIMSRSDHQEIADIVNRRKPGSATYTEIKMMSHNFTLHPSINDAFSGANPSYASQVFTTIREWLKNIQTLR